jgi:anti-sigma regulatory factor (Ser/Thr protein kinase)
VATAGAGIYKLMRSESQPNKFELLNFSSGPNSPLNRVNCLVEDKAGRIWFGCESGGIGLIEQGKLSRMFTKKDGLASDGITSMTIDQAGYLWIGTAADGVSSLKLSDPAFHFETINTASGLTSGNVYLLVTDENDNLIIGTESGLDRLKLDTERRLLELKHFGKTEGFVAIETCRNAVFKDKGGVLWFGTINGLTKFNPHNKARNTLPPNIRITGINLFYEPLEKTSFAGFIGPWGQVTQTLIFKHDQNHIGFDFTGINLSAPENVHYKWKLEGFDKDWSPEVKRKDATYSNLPPGDYTFQVKASNEDGVWNPVPATINFRILKPFWMEVWFIASYSILLALLLLLLFRWRVRVVRKNAEVFRQKLETEKTLLELEQKALRLQMNPHFIFNALNSIQAQITENNEQTARYYLAKFSKLMRMILENSRSSQISLEEEIKTLENYLELEKFSSGDQFDYSIQSDPHLNLEEDLLPPMMIQPFVENAIIHGLKHLNHRGQISISFAKHGNLLECHILDNGIGRKQAALLNKAQRDEHHKSTALIVTQERLDLLQKEKNIRSLEIVDLMDASGNATGTEVIIRIPFS